MLSGKFSRVASSLLAAAMTSAACSYSWADESGASPVTVVTPASPLSQKPKLGDIDSWEIENYTVRLTGPITIEMAEKLNKQLRYLDAHNPDNKDITVLINSYGGSVDAGFTIYDTLKSLKSDVRTVCIGPCQSMAAFILTAGGTPGKRSAMPDAAIMYHQPSSSCSGKVSDMEICGSDAAMDKLKMRTIIAAYSGLPPEQVKIMMERDFHVTPENARDYGLIDTIEPMRGAPANQPRHRIPNDVLNRVLNP